MTPTPVLLALALAAAPPQEPIKVGALLAVTGPASFLGAPEARTLEMLVEELNRSGGLAGRKVQLVVKDTGANPEKAISFAKQLIEEEQVFAIIGPATSGETMAVKPIVEEGKTLLLSCAAAEVIVNPVTPHVFKVAPKDALAVEMIYRRMKKMGVKRIGFLSSNTGFGKAGKDQVDFLQLRVDDIYRAPEIAQTVAATLGDQYNAQDSAEMNRSLFSALLLEKIAVSLAIGLIVMVAALNIIASLILLVMEKSRDIAILKTMGTSARSVTVIFIMQGLIIGIVGTTVGAAAGYGLSFVFDRYQLIRVPIDIYQVSHLPFTVLPSDFLTVVAVAILVCFVATIYPSRQAARLDPAQALRYE